MGTYSRRDAFNFYATVLEFVDTQKFFDFSIADVLRDLQGKNKSPETNISLMRAKELIEEVQYIPGAVPLLAKEGTLTFKGTQTARGKAAAFELMNKYGVHPTEFQTNEINTLAEKDALESIAATDATLAVLVYGGNHNSPISKPEAYRFRERIKEWNSVSDSKFSFVSITPRTYEEHDPTIQILK